MNKIFVDKATSMLNFLIIIEIACRVRSPGKCSLLNTYLGTVGRASDEYAARILAVKSVFISRHDRERSANQSLLLASYQHIIADSLPRTQLDYFIM
uniref:Uncharacterized protein n=1 Tax=Romanomermis culicivorax TaxID=13658 RepID=A0A915IGF6_ROMCU